MRKRAPLTSCAALLTILGLTLSAPPAQAQLLGGRLPGGLPGVNAPLGQPPLATLGRVTTLAEQALDATRDLGANVTAVAGARLLREHPDALEPDDAGRPLVRGVLLALAPTPAALDRARAAGFRIRKAESQSALGLATVSLQAPRGLSALEALMRLRTLDPAGQYDVDPIYLPSGRIGPAATPAAAAPERVGADVRLGLLDGSIVREHRVFRGVRVQQQAFGPGGARVSQHATAVASLMVGRDGAFRGAAPGASLYVADIYGPTPAGGSAEVLVRGLGWLAQNRTPVIDISLVGPPNIVLEAAIKALVMRGYLIVAAVGNDGPAAPPLYPASYPGVLAVTGVDARKLVLPEASRAAHLDFAAPGGDMAAAGAEGGFVAVRGTSFAAPIVAGALARDLKSPDPTQAQAAIAAVSRRALHLGEAGPDDLYGRGLVGFELRTDPARVGAQARPLRAP